MSTIFRRHSALSCFFCRSPVPTPRDPRNFLCPTCNCWNRYDARGEIISDEPAMHDESLNSGSFARRASPSKDNLPTMYNNMKGPFCHDCQTNQMLINNLRSNYLPSPEHPEYQYRLRTLPEYEASLHLRYPPVCADCAPAVEEEIRKKDTMARAKALGGWLQESRGRDQRRRVSATKGREKVVVELAAWRVRGCMWAASLAAAVVCNTSGALGYQYPTWLTLAQPVLPFVVLISILWTVWDPTYASYRRAQVQGREVRLRGKNKYIAFQISAWLSRLLTTLLLATSWHRPDRDYLQLSAHPASTRARLYFALSLAIELFVNISAFYVLRLQLPPTIRLVDTKSHDLRSRSSTPAPHSFHDTARSPSPALMQQATEPDLFASLTLSSKPVLPPRNPVFGLPSMHATPQPPTRSHEEDENAMDWTPTKPSNADKGKQRHQADDDDGSWLRPQRFFAPEKPTGLEGLFERTMMIDEDELKPKARRRTSPSQRWTWLWIGAASLVPLAGVFAFRMWVWWKSREQPVVMYGVEPWPSHEPTPGTVTTAIPVYTEVDIEL